MSVDFTVAIPTYNGATRLPKVLEKLTLQTGTEQLNWEILVVDNNSSDATAEVVKEYQASWDNSMSLRYCFESQQGAAFARQLAIRKAKGELIAFLDDDNWPDPNWVRSAYTFAQHHPQAGAIGGQIHGDLEVEPPANFERIRAFLAIREHGPEPHLFDPDNLRLPPGASLLVRKTAWLESVPPRPTLTGKLPGVMVQGDDYEPLLYMHKAGWEIWYNPAMHTYHQIPHWRLEREYLLNISRGCGLATCQLKMINTKSWQKPWVIAKTFLGNSRRFVAHYLKYRKQLKQDLVTACELEFFRASLMSSFYLLRLKS